MDAMSIERSPMDKELVLSYHPEKGDYVKASHTLAMKTPSFIIVGILILLVVIASVMVLILPAFGNAPWPNAALVGLAMGVFYVLNFWLIIPYQLSRAYKKNENLRKERKLAFSNSGVRMEVGERITEFSWENFQRVIRRGHFYMMIYKAEERIYPFIPERVFEKGASEEDFLALLAEKSIPVR